MNIAEFLPLEQRRMLWFFDIQAVEYEEKLMKKFFKNRNIPDSLKKYYLDSSEERRKKIRFSSALCFFEEIRYEKFVVKFIINCDGDSANFGKVRASLTFKELFDLERHLMTLWMDSISPCLVAVSDFSSYTEEKEDEFLVRLKELEKICF